MGDKEPKYAQELESTGSVINAVATTDGAIGYASLANVDERKERRLRSTETLHLCNTQGFR